MWCMCFKALWISFYLWNKNKLCLINKWNEMMNKKKGVNSNWITKLRASVFSKSKK